MANIGNCTARKCLTESFLEYANTASYICISLIVRSKYFVCLLLPLLLARFTSCKPYNIVTLFSSFLSVVFVCKLLELSPFSHCSIPLLSTISRCSDRLLVNTICRGRIFPRLHRCRCCLSLLPPSPFA